MQRDRLPAEALDQLFCEARTARAWTSRPVPLDVLEEAYALARLGPTASNSCPARFAFVTTPEGRARLLPCLAAGNVEKVRAAPVAVIIAWDAAFYDQLGALGAPQQMRELFIANPALAEETARRNSALQAAYLMVAARALGLDCLPMSGFDAAALDAEFFPEGRWRSDLICCLGCGDDAALQPRRGRLAFKDACRVL